MSETKIIVKDEDLRKGAEAGMDGFLQVFIDKYLEVTGGCSQCRNHAVAQRLPAYAAGISFFP